MPALITPELAKWQLRITYTEEDGLLDRYIAQASQLVIDYVKATYADNGDGTWTATRPPAWTLETVPPSIEATVLMVTAHLWRFRGDEAYNAATDGPLQQRIRDTLAMYRDPTLA